MQVSAGRFLRNCAAICAVATMAFAATPDESRAATVVAPTSAAPGAEFTLTVVPDPVYPLGAFGVSLTYDVSKLALIDVLGGQIFGLADGAGNAYLIWMDLSASAGTAEIEAYFTRDLIGAKSLLDFIFKVRDDAQGVAEISTHYVFANSYNFVFPELYEDTFIQIEADPLTPVPLPASGVLLGLALMGAAGLRRLRK